METTDQTALSEEQIFDALDDVPAEESIETEAEEAPIEESTEADEEAIEESDEAEDSDDDEPDEIDEDDEAEAESDQEADTFTVKVDGKDEVVSLDDLKRSYSGQKFIQKGMEENADARKALQAEYQALQDQRTQFAQVVENVQKTGVIPQPSPPDPSRAQTDPIGYMQDRAAYESDVVAYQQQQQQIQATQQQSAQATQKQREAYVAEQRSKLIEAIPDFGDPQKAAKVRDAIVDIGSEYGFSQEELANVADARAIVALHDLLKLKAVNASKRKVEKKVASARPATKPGNANKSSGKSAKQRENLQKLRETGGDEYALRLLDE